MTASRPPGALTDPPANAFVPVADCWVCALLHTVARVAWHGESGLTLRDWLSVTASGMHHRVADHRLEPAAPDPPAGTTVRAPHRPARRRRGSSR
ncbi:hypothetical protein [Streptomyces tropicalis]|uniref:Uncharacterized protein n=1 Tax=Streptomyces tropicalis TaxID=3034234 RepID=A0ABT6A6F0_9ACTN|nr:hypothetical protein [Streptomyces tropicalis]MDF3300225.1 hypothetical protein [Streptomyces tropicalis]